MPLRVVRALLCAACLLLPVAAVAADLVPVDDFAQHPVLSQPTLSPNGQYIAINANLGTDPHALVVYRVDDMAHPVSMLRLPKYEVAVSITWVSNTRLVMVKDKLFGSIDKPMSTGEVIAADLDGKHQDYLYGYQSGTFGSRAGTRNDDDGFGSVDGVPTPPDGHFYYLATQSFDLNSNNSALYDVDAIGVSRHLIGEINVANMNFMVGADGKAHFAYGHDNDWNYEVCHQQPGGWARMTAAQIGGSFTPIYFTPDGHGIYARYAAGGGPTSLVQQDENGDKRTMLANSGFRSVGTIEWTVFPYRPFATIPATGAAEVTYIDPNLPMAKLHRALSLKRPGFVDFLQSSEGGSELLFEVPSDRDPGSYYLINTHTYKVTKLFAVLPSIDPAKMAERRSIHFKASDGMELEAILTFPNGVPRTDLPMVLLPHAGPIDVQDTWFYDNDAQFLANRGYLVVQVNYRGSSGHGYDFRRAGYLK